MPPPQFSFPSAVQSPLLDRSDDLLAISNIRRAPCRTRALPKTAWPWLEAELHLARLVLSALRMRINLFLSWLVLLANCGGGVAASPGQSDGGDLGSSLTLSCSSGADSGTDPCYDGRSFESPPSCLAGNISQFGNQIGYSDEVESLRQPNTCADFPTGRYGMVRSGTCGSYRFIETQGLGAGVIVHRFYDQSGNLVGAQTRDDVAGKCYQSFGLIPQCQLVQCEVICFIPGWTC